MEQGAALPTKRGRAGGNAARKPRRAAATQPRRDYTGDDESGEVCILWAIALSAYALPSRHVTHIPPYAGALVRV